MNTLTIDSINCIIRRILFFSPDKNFFKFLSSAKASGLVSSGSIHFALSISFALRKFTHFHRTIISHRNNVLSIISRSLIRLSVSALSFLFHDKKRSLIFNFHLFYTSFHLIYFISSISSHLLHLIYFI